MKPKKNKVYCPDCNRTKMLFPSEEKALNFMRFNTAEILEESNTAPIRAYYCDSCSGWHLTSLENYTYQGPTHAEKVLQDARKRENYAILYQAQVAVKNIEELIKKGTLAEARKECKNFLSFCEEYDDSLKTLPLYEELMSRFSFCLQACDSQRIKIETLLEETEAIAEEIDKEELLDRLHAIKSIYGAIKSDPNADPIKLEEFKERINRITTLCQDDIAASKINDKLQVLISRKTAAEKSFENKNWIGAKRLYLNTKEYKGKLDRRGIPTPEMPELNKRIEICTLYAGIKSIKMNLDAAERMLAAGPDPTIRYFIDTAQQELFKICEIEGENEKKLELLDQLEAVRKLYLSKN